MSKMRKSFEDVTPGAKDFIYMESIGEYIPAKVVRIHSQEAKADTARLVAFNEAWYYWQIAWQGGKDDKDET